MNSLLNLKKHLGTLILSIIAIVISIVAATFAWYTVNDNVSGNVLGIEAGGVGRETLDEVGRTFRISNPPFAKLVENNGVIEKWQVKSPLGLVDYSDNDEITTLDTPASKNDYEIGLTYTDPDIDAQITTYTFSVRVTKTVAQTSVNAEDLVDYSEYLQYALVSQDGTICFSTMQEDENGVSVHDFTATLGENEVATNILSFQENLLLYIWFDTQAPENAKFNDYTLDLHVDFVNSKDNLPNGA